MPANPQQIHSALREIGARIQEQAQQRVAAERQALRLIRVCAQDPAGLRGLIERVSTSAEPGIRCALPTDEALDSAFPEPGEPGACTLVAVDGSQVVPDRHEEVLFALVNIGTVVIHTNSGRVPEIETESALLFGRDLYPDNGSLLSEGDIALRRDTRERTSLLRVVESMSGVSIALTDGPLELWGAKDVGDPSAYERALLDYIGVLRQLEARSWTIAGYVDKPGADLVTRLLEVFLAAPEDTKRLRHYHPLHGVSDRWLFGQILPPKSRSAIFELQSTSRAKYLGALAIHFFYLNVGSEGHPWIARVEIPQWVAHDAASTNTLQAVLLEQCSALGARPYPYILHRAHETARITDADKEQIKLQILMEFRHQGIEPEAQSAKSSAKARAEVKGSY